MAYSSSNLQATHSPFTDGPRAFIYRSTDSHGTVEGAGYFAGAGAGGRTNNDGMRVGDLLIAMMHSTDGSSAATLHIVSASTADQASTSASTGWAANYNATVSAAST